MVLEHTACTTFTTAFLFVQGFSVYEGIIGDCYSLNEEKETDIEAELSYFAVWFCEIVSQLRK